MGKPNTRRNELLGLAPANARECRNRRRTPLSSRRRTGETLALALRRDTAAGLLVGGVSTALLLGAFAFQYLGGLPPCEMCIWQRWPHGAAILLGIGGGALAAAGVLPAKATRLLVWLAVIALIVTGAIGVFHAGVEWKL